MDYAMRENGVRGSIAKACNFPDDSFGQPMEIKMPSPSLQ